MSRIELLAPAGDEECLEFALAYGADAVYLGAKEFGMRSSSDNFTLEQIHAAAMEAHRRGKAVYLTLNTLPTNQEMDRLDGVICGARDAGIDAFIVADLGVLALVKQLAPGVAVHFSTQAGITNYATARAAFDLGASRVVLARELTLEDIAAIRAKTPRELELEVFVHGAMCMSVSGRCLLSNYLAGRDANRGRCAQSCRWKYSLLEEKRPGEQYEIDEHEYGSYILSADDLCAAPFLDRVVHAGATSLKIEGRSKSFYYAASVTAAYRAALDAAEQGSGGYILPAFTAAELTKTSHRPYSPGFFLGGKNATQTPRQGGYIREWQLVGVARELKDGLLWCEQRGKFTLGEELETLTPDGKVMRFTPGQILNEAGEPIEATPHTRMRYALPDAPPLPPLAILRRRTGEAEDIRTRDYLAGGML